jgi:ornithine cyclodeaminase/alanine dehydrogenase-like protein (mu-crystallin family)
MTTRRSFLTSSSAVAISAATHAFAANGNSDIKIALIGCGGRGTGACNQALNAGSTIKLVAVLDPLEGKAQAALDILKQKHEGQVDVPPDQVFTQFEDWQKVYQLADVVLITTPPGPRPFLFKQAIKAGKHVFLENPSNPTPMAGIPSRFLARHCLCELNHSLPPQCLFCCSFLSSSCPLRSSRRSRTFFSSSPRIRALK